MPFYLTRFSYTPETWARLIANPEDRRKAAQGYIESVGGKLHGFWYAFGEHADRGSTEGRGSPVPSAWRVAAPTLRADQGPI
jgi:uncharacterized protein with GYD domain